MPSSLPSDSPDVSPNARIISPRPGLKSGANTGNRKGGSSSTSNADASKSGFSKQKRDRMQSPKARKIRAPAGSSNSSKESTTSSKDSVESGQGSIISKSDQIPLLQDGQHESAYRSQILKNDSDGAITDGAIGGNSDSASKGSSKGPGSNPKLIMKDKSFNWDNYISNSSEK
jgi:hypothetical protein